MILILMLHFPSCDAIVTIWNNEQLMTKSFQIKSRFQSHDGKFIDGKSLSMENVLEVFIYIQSMNHLELLWMCSFNMTLMTVGNELHCLWCGHHQNLMTTLCTASLSVCSHATHTIWWMTSASVSLGCGSWCTLFPTCVLTLKLS